MIIFFSISLMMLILPYMTYAFGISTPYIKDDTLQLRPGEEYTYEFTVQNGEDQDYYVTLECNSTGDIAELTETHRMIPQQTYNNTFKILIRVPRDTVQGERYSITYSARPQINESGSVTMGVEIRRGLNVEIGGEVVPITQKDAGRSSQPDDTKKYLMIMVLFIIAALVIMLIGKTSKSIASRIGDKKQTDYTISQAMSLEEVKTLLMKISDKEFEFPEIRKLFKEKLTELSSKRTAKSIHEMSRKELIEAIEKFGKENKK